MIEGKEAHPIEVCLVLGWCACEAVLELLKVAVVVAVVLSGYRPAPAAAPTETMAIEPAKPVRKRATRTRQPKQQLQEVAA